MPARFRGVPIATLQPASTTPVEVQKPCLCNSRRFLPDVVNTVPRLLVLVGVEIQRFNQGFQMTFIEFVITQIHPWLPFQAVSVDRLGSLAEVLFGMKAGENLCGLRE